MLLLVAVATLMNFPELFDIYPAVNSFHAVLSLLKLNNMGERNVVYVHVHVCVC